MIDTLKVRLNDYELNEDNKFHFVGSVCNSKGEIIHESLLTRIESNEIHGSKAYYNDELFNCTMHSLKTNVDETQNNLIIQLSVPRLFSGKHNLLSLDYDQTKTAFKLLQKKLKETGIKTNLLNSEILRIDTFKNIETERNFTYYKDIFSVLKLSRKRETDYGSTHLYQNSTSQVCIYDKVKEMTDKYKTKALDYVPSENIIRFENRLIKKRKVLSELQFNDLKTLITKDGYNQVCENYYDTMKTSIFRLNNVSDVNYYVEQNLKTELDYFRKNYKRNYIESWFKYKGYENILKYTKLETLVDVIKEIESETGETKEGNYRKRKYDLKKIFDNFSIASKFLESDVKDDFSLYSLYKELETKMFTKVS